MGKYIVSVGGHGQGRAWMSRRVARARPAVTRSRRVRRAHETATTNSQSGRNRTVRGRGYALAQRRWHRRTSATNRSGDPVRPPAQGLASSTRVSFGVDLMDPHNLAFDDQFNSMRRHSGVRMRLSINAHLLSFLLTTDTTCPQVKTPSFGNESM